MQPQLTNDELYQQQLQKLLTEHPDSIRMLVDPQMAEVFQRLAKT